MTDRYSSLGGAHERPDAFAKVTGQTRYSGDISLPGMLHAAVAEASTASAHVVDVDTSDAADLDGVAVVLTAADIPGENQIGVIFEDQPLMVTDRIRMVGDRIAIVAAESPEIAHRAASLVTVGSQPLPGVFDPVEALEPDSPTLHGDSNLFHTFQVSRGEWNAAAAETTTIVDAEYHIGGQDHAYLEPQACLVIPEGRRVTVVASCQCPFYIQRAVARVLGINLASVRVEQAPTGGAFGGKEDYPSEPAACAALLAWATGRPVRLLYTREQDLQTTTKRHTLVIHHRWGADAEGKLLFAEVDAILDAGAYAGLSTVVAERANCSAIGPYHVPVVRVETRIALTNNLFAGAYRGFGAPQVSVTAEATMDRLARRLGMDPVEFRRKNLFGEEGGTTCTGQKLPSPVLARACLDRALADSDAAETPARAPSFWKRGTGVGLMMYGINLHRGGQMLDRSSAVVIIQSDGSVIVRVGLTEMGQGNLVAVQAVAAEALGIRPASVEVWQPDTTTVGDSGPTVASRGSHSSGRAVLDAIRRLRLRLDPVAAELLGCDPSEVELVNQEARCEANGHSVGFEIVAKELAARRIESIATGWYRSEPRDFDETTGQGDAYSSYAMACHVAKVAVDPDLGIVRVEHVAAAHDVGTVLHQSATEGQVEGGIVQAMGWALTEELKLKNGRLLNPSFTDYLIPSADDAPPISVALLEGSPGRGPFGAKGIGEPSFIPAAAAIRNAVSNALGENIDRLPLTPPTIVKALAPKHRLKKLIDSD